MRQNITLYIITEIIWNTSTVSLLSLLQIYVCLSIIHRLMLPRRPHASPSRLSVYHFIVEKFGIDRTLIHRAVTSKILPDQKSVVGQTRRRRSSPRTCSSQLRIEIIMQYLCASLSISAVLRGIATSSGAHSLIVIYIFVRGGYKYSIEAHLQ